ncbi:MAG: SprT-like domain-containing protein [Lachnospiraceae bacterium]|nr:SprT-like domain-containing protein [Lachnospiraceae bacterium]
MKEISSAKEYEAELTRIYNRLNKHFWNNELPEVIITFTPKRGPHGHLTPEPVWTSGNDKKYELNINAYSIDRSPEDISATILHEQCHLYNAVNGIQDTSNNHRYHNKQFKITAEDHGLDVKKAEGTGWSVTTLDSSAKGYISRLKIRQFEYKRESANKKSGTFTRYCCPGCTKTIVYTSSPQFVICGKCGAMLIPTPYNRSAKSNSNKSGNKSVNRSLKKSVNKSANKSANKSKTIDNSSQE